MEIHYYSFHEERGEFKAYVENEQGDTIWSVSYPDFYENEDGELIESSTIFEDGYMEDAKDIEGLENYLKSLGILQMGDEIVAAKMAYGGYMANGGGLADDFDYELFLKYVYSDTNKALKSNGILINKNFGVSDGGTYYFEPQIIFQNVGGIADKLVLAYYDYDDNYIGNISYDLENQKMTIEFTDWGVNDSTIFQYEKFANGGETDSNTFEKVKVTIRDVDMGGDVVYKGEHFFRKDQLAKKTNEEIGKYILNKYFLDYGNTYKYSIIRTGETKTKMADGGGVEYDEDRSYGNRYEDYDDNFQRKMREKAVKKMMQPSNYRIEDYKESNFNKNDDDSAVKMDKQLKYKAIIGNYEPYHNTLSEVLSEAERFVNDRGYKFSEESYFPDITNGGVGYGQTVRTRRDIVEIGGKNRSNTLILSVYRLESGRYELVMYFAKSKY